MPSEPATSTNLLMFQKAVTVATSPLWETLLRWLGEQK